MEDKINDIVFFIGFFEGFCGIRVSGLESAYQADSTSLNINELEERVSPESTLDRINGIIYQIKK